MLGRWWAGTNGGVAIPGGVAVGKDSLCQDPSQIMLWVMSCWLGSVVAALSLWEPSEHLFSLYILLADREPFLTTEAANGGRRSDFVFMVLVWSEGLNSRCRPNSCPELP